jgi:hypothetical protein
VTPAASTTTRKTPKRPAAAKPAAKRAAAKPAPPEPPPPPPLDKVLDHTDPDYLECRDYGHVWKSYGARWFDALRLYEQQLRCPRCGTVRIRQLSSTGRPLHGGYDYPEGYLMPKGTGRLTSGDRDGIRLRTLLRVLDKTAETG